MSDVSELRSLEAGTPIPFGGNNSDSVILAEGYQMEPGESLVTPSRVVVTPGYFEQLQITPQLGALPGPNDEHALLLSHALWERRYGSDAAVVGRIIDLGGTSMEVFGVLPPDFSSENESAKRKPSP